MTAPDQERKAMEAAERVYVAAVLTPMSREDAREAMCRAYAAALTPAPSPEPMGPYDPRRLAAHPERHAAPPGPREPSEDEGIKLALEDYVEARKESAQSFRAYSETGRNAYLRLTHCTEKLFAAVKVWAAVDSPASPEPTDEAFRELIARYRTECEDWGATMRERTLERVNEAEEAIFAAWSARNRKMSDVTPQDLEAMRDVAGCGEVYMGNLTHDRAVRMAHHCRACQTLLYLAIVRRSSLSTLHLARGKE